MKSSVGKFILSHFTSYKLFFIFIALFLILIFTRFSDTQVRNGFAWDQVDNAWVSKDIIVDQKFPLVGMQAKGNTGFFIGPYYYYFLVPFYFATNLDPVASGIAAGVVACFTFFVTFFVMKNMFNIKIAFLAIFFTVFSSYIITQDRVQWPVNFIVPLSFLIFFSLYKICNNRPSYILLLAGAFGFSLHIHFTSVFYAVFILLALPFFPRSKQTIKFILLSLPLLLFFVWPIALQYALTKSGDQATSYLGSSFHGFHLRRFLQISGDGLIEFNSLLKLSYGLYVSIAAIFLFLILLARRRKNFILLFLASIWVLVPWVAFSTYTGEITNYYFAITRPIALIVFSYLFLKIFNITSLSFLRKKKIANYVKYSLCAIALFLASMYALTNYMDFEKNSRPVGLKIHRDSVEESIERGVKVEFSQGNPQSYLYYIYKERFEKK